MNEVPETNHRGLGRRLIDALKWGLHPQSGPIAVLALLVAMGHAGWQCYRETRPVKLELLEPGSVVIRPVKYGDGEYYLHFAAPLRYVSKGPRDGRAVIIGEELTYSIGSRTFDHTWQNEVEFKGSDCELELHEEKLSKPVVLSGNDGSGHITEFMPKGRDPYELKENRQSWPELISSLVESDSIKITLIANRLGGETVQHTCRVTFEAGMREYLETRCPLVAQCVAESE